MTFRKRDYEVGKGKPPKDRRFAKGKSGNPKGRPKGSKNFGTELEDVLNAKVAVTEDGFKKRVTSRKATLMRLREKALKGDVRAMDRYLGFAQQHAADKEAATTETKLNSSEEDILQRFLDSQMPPTAKGDDDDPAT